MRTNLHVERRRAPRKSPAVIPRELRRARHPRRHGMRTRCGYFPAISFI